MYQPIASRYMSQGTGGTIQTAKAYMRLEKTKAVATEFITSYHNLIHGI